jgi:hypothetical protein
MMQGVCDFVIDEALQKLRKTAPTPQGALLLVLCSPKPDGQTYFELPGSLSAPSKYHSYSVVLLPSADAYAQFEASPQPTPARCLQLRPKEQRRLSTIPFETLELEISNATLLAVAAPSTPPRLAGLDQHGFHTLYEMSLASARSKSRLPAAHNSILSLC